MDRLRRRDCWGLLVAFPLQTRELVRIAPELAGRELAGTVHGLEMDTRRVLGGADLVPAVMRRLPRWCWLSAVLRLAPLRALLAGMMARAERRRLERLGRVPHAGRSR